VACVGLRGLHIKFDGTHVLNIKNVGTHVLNPFPEKDKKYRNEKLDKHKIHATQNITYNTDFKHMDIYSYHKFTQVQIHKFTNSHKSKYISSHP
jgi:hypothetical protein